MAGGLLLSKRIAPRLLEDFVKKRLHSVSFLATLAVLFGIISWGGLLHAQQTPSDSQPQTQQPPTQPSPDAQPPATRQSPDQPSHQTPDQTTPSQGAAQGSQAQPTDQAGGQTFTGTVVKLTGTVVKQGDKYVLQDAATGTTYDIDHQDEVKKFDGKKVRVHGTLDASGKMIHVQ